MKKLIVLFLFFILALVSCGSPSTNDKGSSDLTKTDLAEIYSEAADFMLDVSRGGTETVRLGYVESNEHSTLNSTVAMIKLISLLYEAESFVISEEFVQFKVSIANNIVNMAFLSEEYIEDNKLLATLIYTVDDDFNFEQCMFLHFDIDYNFETKEILGFEVKTSMAKEPNNHFKYENGKFYEYSPSSSIDEEINDNTIVLVEKYFAKTLNSTIIDADYGNEYAAAMQYAFGE